MTRHSLGRQKGAVARWLIFVIAVAVAGYLGWQRFNTVERLGPSIPVLISPAAGHTQDPDAALNQLVWPSFCSWIRTMIGLS